jgi:hypothetical protein
MAHSPYLIFYGQAREHLEIPEPRINGCIHFARRATNQRLHSFRPKSHKSTAAFISPEDMNGTCA